MKQCCQLKSKEWSYRKFGKKGKDIQQLSQNGKVNILWKFIRLSNNIECPVILYTLIIKIKMAV